jgi:hypothetical protein
MQFGKLARFAIVFLLGLALVLVGYPARSQNSYPEPEACYSEVLNDINDYFDLDEYDGTELYCWFVVEILDSGVIEKNTSYPVDELYDLILMALEDTDDISNGSALDDKLTFAEIEAEFPGDQLNQMIAEAVALSEQNQASLTFSSSNSSIPQAKAIAQRFETMHLRQPLNPIAQEERSRSGRTVARATGRSATKRAKSNPD